MCLVFESLYAEAGCCNIIIIVDNVSVEPATPTFIANLAEYGLKPDDPPLVPIVTVGTEEGTQ